MFGPKVRTLNTVADGVNMAVASGAVIYTHSFELSRAVYFGIAYRATSVLLTPNVLIQLQQSWVKPSTECAADTNYVIPVGMADIETNLMTELWRIKSLSPVPMPYARFIITGNSGNQADTLVNINVAIQED